MALCYFSLGGYYLAMPWQALVLESQFAIAKTAFLTLVTTNYISRSYHVVTAAPVKATSIKQAASQHTSHSSLLNLDKMTVHICYKFLALCYTVKLVIIFAGVYFYAFLWLNGTCKKLAL